MKLSLDLEQLKQFQTPICRQEIDKSYRQAHRIVEKYKKYGLIQHKKYERRCKIGPPTEFFQITEKGNKILEWFT